MPPHLSRPKPSAPRQSANRTGTDALPSYPQSTAGQCNIFAERGLRRADGTIADRLVGVWEGISGRAYHPWAEVVLLVDIMSWTGRHRADEPENLERALAQRLAELG